MKKAKPNSVDTCYNVIMALDSATNLFFHKWIKRQSPGSSQ